MKTSLVRFAQLRDMLIDLGFKEFRTGDSWRFEHAESDTIFVFRPYGLDEQITMQDLASTRLHLDWRGLLSQSVFDNSVTRAPA